MGSPSRIGRLLAIGVIGVAALLIVGLLRDESEDAPLGTFPDSGTPAVARTVRGPAPHTPGVVPGGQYEARLAARLMFVHPRRAEEGGAVYPLYPEIRDPTFAREVRDVFVPMSAMFDTTTRLDAIGRNGGVSSLRIDPQPFADSLLRFETSSLGNGNLSVRFDVHGSLAGVVAPPWIVALAPGTTEAMPFTPWGARGRDWALLDGRRLAALVSDDTVPALKSVPFHVVSYDRFDTDSAHFVVVHAVREARRHPGAVETAQESVTLVGQSLGSSDDYAPVWSSAEVAPGADLALTPVVAGLRMGTARRPVLLIEVQAGDDVCTGDRRGYFLALMDDHRWRDVGFWEPGC